MDKKEYLMGKYMGTIEARVLYMLIIMFIKYGIWKYKLAGVLPITQYISNDIKNFVNSITSREERVEAAGLQICCDWW